MTLAPTLAQNPEAEPEGGPQWLRAAQGSRTSDPTQPFFHPLSLRAAPPPALKLDVVEPLMGPRTDPGRVR